MRAPGTGRSENVVSRVSDLIGHTPLFELCATKSGTRLLLKLEQFNPTSSAQVRMAEQVIANAELDGRLAPDGYVIEPTSGNAGLGLALAAIERGYPFKAVVDDHAPKDLLRTMQALGAELVHVKDSGNTGPRTGERHRLAAEIAANDEKAYRPDQHDNPGNWKSYRGLAQELLSDTFGDVDYLISAIRTGGSLCGTARELRRLGSRARTIGVAPLGSTIFDDQPARCGRSGSGSQEDFPVGTNVDHSLIDEGGTVGDVEAFATARVLARATGLLMGGSTGGAVNVALRRLHVLPAGSTAVTLVCDSGEKYLDTVYDDEWMRERDLLDPVAEQDVQHLLDTAGLDLVERRAA